MQLRINNTMVRKKLRYKTVNINKQKCIIIIRLHVLPWYPYYLQIIIWNWNT